MISTGYGRQLAMGEGGTIWGSAIFGGRGRPVRCRVVGTGTIHRLMALFAYLVS
jgi:hypothetical protein